MRFFSIIVIFQFLACSISWGQTTVVNLTTGKAQGDFQEGIYTYKGIPYAKAKRFMAPQNPDSWKGIRTFAEYAPICPQAPMAGENDFISNQCIAVMGEDCLNLNVWTPQTGDGKKRPVMVWLHGGGFQTGSAIEQKVYDGANLSRKGDVVVVSVNHRLNVFGFLDLSAYGDKYKYSGNVGTMDMVAALKWIKENVAAFGGDPDNITLFGQSGGGAKIIVLMTVPAAKGLFNKGIIQSGAVEGCGMTNVTTEIGKRVAELTLLNLGVNKNKVDKIQSVPYKELMRASDKAMTQTAQERNISDCFGNPNTLLWTPIVDGDYLPFQPVVDSISSRAKNIPLMIGTAMTEWSTMGMLANAPIHRDNNRNTWNDGEINAKLKEHYGEKSDAIVKVFRKAYPERSKADALYVESLLRTSALKTARLKADQKGAPVYNYMFAWDTPIEGGYAMSYHCSELPFVFNNVTMLKASAAGGTKAQALAGQMSGAWINFARYGNPNHEGIPSWPAFTREMGYTMIFGDSCDVRINFDYELMSLLKPEYKF